MNFVRSIFLIIFFLFKSLDCTVLFSNDNARILVGSGSAVKINPSIVLGWQSSSIIANASNAGLGDYK